MKFQFRSNDREGQQWQKRVANRLCQALGARVKVKLDDVDDASGGADKPGCVEVLVQQGSGPVAISATARTWRDSVEAVASRLRQKVVLQTHRATVMEPQTMAGALVAGVRPLLLHEQRARATVFRIRARRETVPLPSAPPLSNPFTSKANHHAQLPPQQP